MIGPGWLVTIGVFLGVALVLSAFLSALETLFLLLKKHRLKVLMAADPKLQRIWGRLADHSDSLFSQAVISSVVTHVGVITAGVWLLREGRLVSDDTLSDWLPFALAGLGVFFCADFLPKRWALGQPAAVCRSAAVPFLALSRVLSPLGAPLAKTVAVITRSLIPAHVMPRKQLLTEELPAMVDLRGQSGVLSLQETRAIREILRLSEKTAKDCMTPRHEVLVIDRRLPVSEVYSRVRHCFHSWYPVSEGDSDAIVGVLDGWSFVWSGNDDIDRHIKPPLRVPETMPAIDLLYKHLDEPHRLAVVIDEYGGFEGVVSHSDLLEEVLEDSIPDPTSEEEILVLQPGRRVQVLGHARLDDLGEVLGLPLERDGLDTIGGLVYNELGRLPHQHETVRCGELFVTVTKVVGARIEEMIVERRENGDQRELQS